MRRVDVLSVGLEWGGEAGRDVMLEGVEVGCDVGGGGGGM